MFSRTITSREDWASALTGLSANVLLIDYRGYGRSPGRPSEEGLYQQFRPNYPEEWGDEAPEGSTASAGFYNTMFMWPLLTFGYENFLGLCLEPGFERIMEEFAEKVGYSQVLNTFKRLEDESRE